MNADDNKAGLVLQCDLSGDIIRILRDDLAVTAGCPLPLTFFGIVELQSRGKARDFLETVREAHAACGWELNVRCDGHWTGLFLAGGLVDEGIIICGFRFRTGLDSLFAEIIEFQNEQMIALRKALTAEQLSAARQRALGQEMLDTFTVMNNELVNMQRELSQRNATLADANARLEALATTDGLTGLKNHRAFQESLEGEFARAARHGLPLSLLILDVDYFKRFNDQFGHPAGDMALKQVAQILVDVSRSETLIARYGGEEFALILPNCESEQADIVAERVRHAVEVGPWDLRPITVSVGAAAVTIDTQDRVSLIVRADAAMYRAKVNGGNQVCSIYDACKPNEYEAVTQYP
jgi:diguanylate cyclase (GGDEF)-like protein